MNFLASCGSLGNVDPDSAEFKRLPDEDQYHVLLELTSSKSRVFNDRLGGVDSSNAESFSGYQFAKLLRQGHLTQRLDQLRRRMTQTRADRLIRRTADCSGGSAGRAAEWISAGRGRLSLSKIASEAGGHALLISGAGGHQPAQDWADLLTKSAGTSQQQQQDDDTKDPTDGDSRTPVSSSATTAEAGEFGDDLEEILDDSYKADEPLTDEQLLAAGGQLVAAAAAAVSRRGNAKPEVGAEVDRGDLNATPGADRKLEDKRKSVAVATVEADAKTRPESDAEARPEADAEARREADAEAWPEARLAEEAKPDAEAEAETEVATQPEAVPVLEASTIAKPTTSQSPESDDVGEVPDVDDDVDDDEFEAVPMLQSPVLVDQAAAAKSKDISSAAAAVYGRTSFLFGANATERALSRQQAELQKQQDSGAVESVREQLGRVEARTESVSQLLVDESRRLISLFGLPVVLSPEEAEAQCARLEQLGLTEGTITDDSDVWLFGASRVYRYVFSRTQQVRRFSLDAIQRRLGLDRRSMVDLALMCGSDYTDGVAGLGPVTAMEMLAEFGSSDNLRRWLDEAGVASSRESLSPAQVKALRLEFPSSFPSARVANAYLKPAVEDSVALGAGAGFDWGRPDLDLIRRFAADRMGWTKEKCDGVMLPLMKRISAARSLLDKFVIRSWRSQSEAATVAAQISASAGPKTVGDGNSRRVGAAAGQLRRRQQRGGEAEEAAEVDAAEQSPVRKSLRRRKKR